MTVDPAGNVVSWNTGAERIFGYSAATMIGRHYSVLYPLGWPLSGPLNAADTLATERLHETWQVRQDGRRFWASVSITAMHGDNGELRGFFRSHATSPSRPSSGAVPCTSPWCARWPTAPTSTLQPRRS